jgi:hypothetical protein
MASTQHHPPYWIDPSDGPVDVKVMRSLLKAFAENPVYRSATVEELVLDDFFRRPLRPEDLSLIDFSSPLDANTASSLSALATHRMLLCINECGRGRLPAGGEEAKWATFRQFYSDRNRILGQIARPFLEHHAFHFLEEESATARADLDSLVETILKARKRRATAEKRLASIVQSSSVAGETRRMQFVQFFGLAETKRRALDGAVGGWLTDFPRSNAVARELLERIPAQLDGTVVDNIGSPVALHACWQFYLPGSMAAANLLYYLTNSGRNALRSLGALFFANIASDEFLLCNADPALGPSASPVRLRRLLADLVEPVADRFGPSVWSEVSTGFSLCAAAEKIADEELTFHLTWIAGLDYYRRLADAIKQKIDGEQIRIDQETFIERSETCSTTHVHDEHRLVIIESGVMVFWAFPGMRLLLSPGEKILVPRHRLHGSSVLSEQCVYHQPIIPEDWIASFGAERIKLSAESRA